MRYVYFSRIMEDQESKISYLKSELESKERDIHLAASIGQQLLWEKEELKKKQEEILNQIEILKQEKHALQLSVNAKEKLIVTQSSEIESIKQSHADVLEKFEQLKKNKAETCQKMNDLQKRNEDLRNMQEEMTICNDILTKQISDLENQIKNFQEQAQISLNETFSEDYQKLHDDYAKNLEEKNTLECAVATLQSELESTKSSESTLRRIINELQEEIQDKDKELSSSFSIVRKCKEEIAELEASVELLKLEQVDVKRRGNSVFGELDDRRIAVEKAYRLLLDKCNSMEESYQHVVQQLRKTKRQVTALINLSSRDEDAAYIQELEIKFRVASNEIKKLNKLLEEGPKKEEIPILTAEQKDRDARIANGTYEYLRTMLSISDKKIKSMEGVMHELRRTKVAESDKLAETLRLLYHAQKKILHLQSAGLRVKHQLDELTNKDLECPKRSEPKIEIIPGFESKFPDEATSLKDTISEQKESHGKTFRILSERNCAINGNTNSAQLPNEGKRPSFQAVDVPFGDVKNNENILCNGKKQFRQKAVIPKTDVTKNTSCTQQ